MKKLFLFAAKPLLSLLVFLFLSCAQDESLVDQTQIPSTPSLYRNPTRINIYRGPLARLGDGTVRSWTAIRSDGFPIEIGLDMSFNTLENLPMDGTEHEALVRLAKQAKLATPFDHIVINWNPQGHPPTGVFTVPHFDFHFYMMPLQERLQIPEWSSETDAAFNNYPPAGYMPATYFTPPGPDTAEARMGKHWLPVNLGDYLPFSKILVLGSYDGQFNFIEPMVTLEHLLTGINSSDAYPQPASFAEPGNYPTKYNIYHDTQNAHIYITLSDFVARN